MPLLIQGPRQPRNDIDVFLEPVIDELVEMFEKGVPDVWDEYKKEHVMIKGVLIATITDLPGRGSLSREKTKGYTRCVECLDDTDAVNLPNNSKIVIWDTVGSYLRITLTVGIKKISTVLLRNA